MALAILMLGTTGAVMAQEPILVSPEETGSVGFLAERQFSLDPGELSAATVEEPEPVDSLPVLEVRREAIVADALLMERAAWRSMTVEEAYAQTTQQSGNRKGGFGRWMRKYWYIPTIVVAALVGVELSDDDKGMDDPE